VIAVGWMCPAEVHEMSKSNLRWVSYRRAGKLIRQAYCQACEVDWWLDGKGFRIMRKEPELAGVDNFLLADG
jgi:hypothetical protein